MPAGAHYDTPSIAAYYSNAELHNVGLRIHFVVFKRVLPVNLQTEVVFP